ncbi:MAG: NAD-dependent epimerase/dehydratase family protein, partial [Polyangiales bacterium]
MRALVTGATGFLGGHVVDALGARGHETRVLARATSRTEDLEARGLEVVRASFDDAESLRRALRDVDVVVHAAGGGIAKDVAALYRANTRSTRALLEAAPSSLRRFVLVSSIAAHGPSAEGRAADGTQPDAPRSHYGKSKLAAERAALERAG